MSDAPTTPDPEMVERAAQALWRLGHPDDDVFSNAAPNDWLQWPETPKQASLVMEDYSKQEYREQVCVVLAALAPMLAKRDAEVERLREALLDAASALDWARYPISAGQARAAARPTTPATENPDG